MWMKTKKGRQGDGVSFYNGKLCLFEGGVSPDHWVAIAEDSPEDGPMIELAKAGNVYKAHPAWVKDIGPVQVPVSLAKDPSEAQAVWEAELPLLLAKAKAEEEERERKRVLDAVAQEARNIEYRAKKEKLIAEHEAVFGAEVSQFIRAWVAADHYTDYSDDASVRRGGDAQNKRLKAQWGALSLAQRALARAALKNDPLLPRG